MLSQWALLAWLVPTVLVQFGLLTHNWVRHCCKDIWRMWFEVSECRPYLYIGLDRVSNHPSWHRPAGIQKSLRTDPIMPAGIRVTRDASERTITDNWKARRLILPLIKLQSTQLLYISDKWLKYLHPPVAPNRLRTDQWPKCAPNVQSYLIWCQELTGICHYKVLCANAQRLRAYIVLSLKRKRRKIFILG